MKVMIKFLPMLVSFCSIFIAMGQNNFNRQTDLLVAQFDGLPDPDDIHSQAALGCFLAHPDYSDINYVAVQGAYGKQINISSFDYIDATNLFTMAFGPIGVNWVDAHIDRAGSAQFIYDKAKLILQAGGRVWVMEGGQSDITADWLALLIADGITNTQTHVTVVHHSAWNENQTTGTKLAYVQANSNFVQIDNGNYDWGSDLPADRGVSTPNYKQADASFINDAVAATNPNAFARTLWTEAKAITSNVTFSVNFFHSGFVDFSDMVNGMHIFDIGEGYKTVTDYWNEFVVNTPSETPRVAYIHGDVAPNGDVPSGVLSPYDQMLLTDTGAKGVSEFKAMVESEGYIIDQYYDQNITLNASFLNQYDVVIFGLHQTIWSTSELSVLDTWVHNGGGVFIYSDSASGGLGPVVGNDNAVGQTVTNNIISQYGMQVTVDQANGIKARNSGGNTHPIVAGDLIIEGEGVSPVAVDPNAGVNILIPYTSNIVSGHATISRLQNITISNPLWASLALKEVGAGNVIVMFDRQPMWNDGPGSDIMERDNLTILNNVITFLAADSGLVAHWAMDEGAGAIVSDVSGNGHDLTLSGASWDNNGAIGSSLAFQSGSGGVALPASAFSDIDQEVSIAMWVNGVSNQPQNNINFRANAGGRALNIHLPWSNSTVYWDAGNTGGVFDRISKSTDMSLFKNSWNHWVFTKNATTGVMNIYVNGALHQTGSGKSYDMAGITSAVLGSNYNGSMDEVMLYNVELSAAEVAALYSPVVEESSLVAHWAMDEGAGAVVADITGNGHDATLNGGLWSANGVIGSGLSFSGSSAGVTLPVSAFAELDQEVTIAMWVNGSDPQPLNNVNFRADAGGRALNIHLPWSNGVVYWDAGNTGGSYDRIKQLADPSLYEGGWNQWVFTKNATTGTMSIYVNGALFKTDSGKTKDMTGITSATFGAQYTGSMDEVMLFDKELTAAEVAGLYQSQGDLGVEFAAVGFDAESHPNSDNIIRDQGSNVGWITNGSWIRFDDFNFGSGASSITISASSGTNGGIIEIRTGSETGALIGSVVVENTGNWSNYQSFSANFNTSVSGISDLYFVFTGVAGGLMNVEAFQVN